MRVGELVGSSLVPAWAGFKLQLELISLTEYHVVL